MPFLKQSSCFIFNCLLNISFKVISIVFFRLYSNLRPTAVSVPTNHIRIQINPIKGYFQLLLYWSIKYKLSRHFYYVYRIYDGCILRRYVMNWKTKIMCSTVHVNAQPRSNFDVHLLKQFILTLLKRYIKVTKYQAFCTYC